MNNQHTSTTTRKGNKLTLLLIVGLLLGPFVLVPLLVNPFDIARKAHGELVMPAVAIGDTTLMSDSTQTTLATYDDNWKLFYVMPTLCDNACEYRILQMERVRRSMDKLINRVSLITLLQQPLDAPWQQRATTEFDEINFSKTSPEALKHISSALAKVLTKVPSDEAQPQNPLNAGHLYLLSPDGHIVVHYPPISDEHDAILDAKGIRKDLRKSIKGART